MDKAFGGTEKLDRYGPIRLNLGSTAKKDLVYTTNVSNRTIEKQEIKVAEENPTTEEKESKYKSDIKIQEA